MRRTMMVLTIFFATILATARPAAAALHVWVGFGDGVSWNDPLNWTGGVPTSNESGGTVVLFVTGTTTTDNIAGLVLDQIHFSGGGNTINGTTTLSFSGAGDAILNDSGTNTLGSTLPISTASVNGLPVTVTAGLVVINGVISGSGAFHLTGPGQLRLNGANTYPLVASVESGTLLLGGASPTIPGQLRLGHSAPGLNVANVQLMAPNQFSNITLLTFNTEGHLDLNGVNASVAGILMNGGSISTTGGLLTLAGTLTANSDTAGNAATITGDIDLAGAVRTFNVTHGSGLFDLFIVGAIGGSAGSGITKTGDGLMRVAGATPNTYPGTTTLSDGSLSLAKDPGVDAIAGPLVVSSHELTLVNAEQIKDSVTVTVTGNGLFQMNGKVENIGALIMQSPPSNGGRIEDSGSGRLVLHGNVTLTAPGGGGSPATINTVLDLNGATRTFDIAGTAAQLDLWLENSVVNGAITKTGTGGLYFLGSNTFAGPLSILSGTVALNGASVPSPINITNGTLEGRGSTGAITGTTGTLHPGFQSGNPGFMTATGLVLAAGMTFDAVGNGINSFGHVNVPGPVTLNSPALTATIPFSTPPGTLLTIIDSASGPITGTFSGLPDGATFSASGKTFRINYNAGADGHDVVLTSLSTNGVPTMPEWMSIFLGASLLLLAALKVRRLQPQVS